MRTTLLFCLMAILSGLGCVSLSTFQTARVLPDTGTQFGAAASTVSSYTLLLEEEGEDSFESVTGGTLEVFYRAAIADNFDVGIKAYFIGAIIDGKYQFHDTERLDMAADLGVGYNRFTVGENDVTILDLYPTLLMTFNLSEKVDLTFAPKIIARFISGPSDNSTLVGGTMMLKFGPIMPEFGYYVGDGDNVSTFGVGIGVNR